MVKSYIKAIVVIVALFFLVTFGIKNSGPVQLSYYFGLFDAYLPLYAVVYAALVIGLLIGMIIGFLNRHGVKKELKAKVKENKEIRAELEGLQAKTAVPVYTENVYIPAAQPAPAEAVSPVLADETNPGPADGTRS